MEKDNKYYTPTIEEFYVGFEFMGSRNWKSEYIKTQADVDTFTPTIFNGEYKGLLESLKGINGNPDRPVVKVKYIDKEDIESLGWKFISDNMGLPYYQRFINSDGWEINLYPGLDETKVFLENREMTFFMGILKNKSELKKLMKQLSVTNK